MKPCLEVNLLGTPRVIFSGTEITFPYRQAEAIFYYMAENKTVSRSVLGDLIWEGALSDEKLNSSLRNAIYTIRKLFGKDFIVKGAGNTLSLNPTVSLSLDTRRFSANPSPELYKGDFLDGFYLKHNIRMNEWIEAVRQTYRELYQKTLRKAIAASYLEGRFKDCEAFCLSFQQTDEFDEISYKYLMQLYLDRGQYSQALQIYNRLEQLLGEELFETPDAQLRALMQKARDGRKKTAQDILSSRTGTKPSRRPSSFFYGRQAQLDQICDSIARLETEPTVRHILVTGEGGIGKSRLLSRALDETAQKKYLLLDTQCYCEEERYILKPWQRPVRLLLQYLEANGLSDANSLLVQSIQILFPFTREPDSPFPDSDSTESVSSDYQQIQSVFISGCIRLSRTMPLVFCFDDLQWADGATLSLLQDFITSLSAFQTPRILFLFASRNSFGGEVQSFIQRLQSQNRLNLLSLERFGFQDTVRMAEQLFPEYPYDDETRELLYEATEGNSLFIVEAVNNLRYNISCDTLTANMRNIIRQRIAPLPREQRKILDLISVFFDGISFQCLLELSQKEDFELVDILEALLNQQLLRECPEPDNIFFSFTHQKMQEYVYDEMSWTKKRLLHRKAACYYESLLSGRSKDMALYPKLMYHFERCADHEKYLRYSIKYLYRFLNVTHEFFPVMERNLTLFNLEMHRETRENLPEDLNAIELLLRSIENDLTAHSDGLYRQEAMTDDMLETISDYLYIIGRHYIRICCYDTGLSYIHRLRALHLDRSSSLRREKLLQANRQLICVYINRCETEMMREVIEDSFQLLGSDCPPDETAVWKRLYGLYGIMTGRVSEAEEALWEAIRLFESSPNREKQRYNIAASYSWLGEICRHAGDYETALSHYEKALSLCSESYLAGGVAIFYAYAGMAAFDAGRFDLASRYLMQAVWQYERGNLMWGRSLAYSYHCLSLLRAGDGKEAFRQLDTASLCAHKLESPYELGVIYRIRAQIKAGVYDSFCPKASYSKKIPETPASYRKKAYQCLRDIYSPIDRMYLEEL